MKRCVYSLVLIAVLAWTTPAEAQSLGTFRWRLASFCSVLNLTVIQYGGVYSLIGYEEQCGGNPRLPVYGTAMLQADGTIWMGLTTIFDFGNGLHTRVTLNSSLSGTWRDNANQSGTLVFNPGAGPFLGGPRITPIVPDPLVDPGAAGPGDAQQGDSLESLAAGIADLQRRLAALAARQKQR